MDSKYWKIISIGYSHYELITRLELKKVKEGVIGNDEIFDEYRFEHDADYRSVWKDIVVNPISFNFARFLNDKTHQQEWIDKMEQ